MFVGAEEVDILGGNGEVERIMSVVAVGVVAMIIHRRRGRLVGALEHLFQGKTVQWQQRRIHGSQTAEMTGSGSSYATGRTLQVMI